MPAFRRPPQQGRNTTTTRDNSSGNGLGSGPSSPQRDDVDGSVVTPAAATTNYSTLLDDLVRLVGSASRRGRGGGRGGRGGGRNANTTNQRRGGGRGGGSDDSSDMEADDEEIGRRQVTATVQDARQLERWEFVQRLENIHEDGDENANIHTELREKEREAIRTTRRNGRWTKVRCFMCSYGNHEYDGTADKGSQPFAQLRNMIRQRYAYSDLTTLCIDCSEFYHVSLREKSLQQDGTYLLPEMLASDFYEHIIYHNLNPQIMIGEDLRLIRDMMLSLRTQLPLASGKTGLRIIDTMIKLMKQRHVYLSQGARPLLFEGRGGNDPIGLDATQMGDVANMTRIRPFIQSTRNNVIGGATATNTSQPRQGLPRFDRMEAAVASQDVDDADENDSAMDEVYNDVEVMDSPARTSPESNSDHHQRRV